MAQVLVRNLGQKPLWVPLTSGAHVCVGPGAELPPMDPVLLEPSAAIDRMKDAGAIGVIHIPDMPQSRTRTKSPPAEAIVASGRQRRRPSRAT